MPIELVRRYCRVGAVAGGVVLVATLVLLAPQAEAGSAARFLGRHHIWRRMRQIDGAALDRHLERVVSRGAKRSPRFERRRARRRLIDRVRRHYTRVDRSIMPDALPPLPRPADPTVATGLAKALGRRSTANQLAEVLATAGALRGRVDAAGADLAARVERYVADYVRVHWGRREFTQWLRGRLKHFDPNNIELVRLSRPKLKKGQHVDRAARARLNRRINQAKRIIARVVHPDLLRALPPAEVVVDVEAKGGRYRRKRNRITLRPDSKLRTILHEFGHHIEWNAGLGPFAMARGLIAKRAQSSDETTLGELDPERENQRDKPAFEASLVRAYAARRYAHGGTEVVSVGMEYLASTKRARALFKKDPEHLLLLLSRLQAKPTQASGVSLAP